MATCLIVVRYLGGSSGFNEDNLRKNMVRDSGISIDYILNECNKTDLVDFFNNWNHLYDRIIVHFISHGCIDGICKEPENLNSITRNMESLVTWSELTHWINPLSKYSRCLLLNLGTVCNSTCLLKIPIDRKFDCIAVRNTTSNTDVPRKLNSRWMKNGIDSLDSPYVFAPKSAYME